MDTSSGGESDFGLWGPSPSPPAKSASLGPNWKPSLAGTTISESDEDRALSPTFRTLSPTCSLPQVIEDGETYSSGKDHVAEVPDVFSPAARRRTISAARRHSRHRGSARGRLRRASVSTQGFSNAGLDQIEVEMDR